MWGEGGFNEYGCLGIVNSAAKGVGLLDKIELSRRSHWRSMDCCTIRNRQEQ